MLKAYLTKKSVKYFSQLFLGFAIQNVSCALSQLLPVVKKAAVSSGRKTKNKTKETPVGCMDSDADKAWQNALGKISTVTQMKSAAASEGWTASCILLLDCVVDDSVHRRACACVRMHELCVCSCLFMCVEKL